MAQVTYLGAPDDCFEVFGFTIKVEPPKSWSDSKKNNTKSVVVKPRKPCSNNEYVQQAEVNPKVTNLPTFGGWSTSAGKKAVKIDQKDEVKFVASNLYLSEPNDKGASITAELKNKTNSPPVSPKNRSKAPKSSRMMKSKAKQGCNDFLSEIALIPKGSLFKKTFKQS